MRNYSEGFHGRRSISYAAFVVLALMLAQPYAQGIDNFFTVDCANSAPGALQAAINALPASPPGGQNVIYVQSNCSENVTISGQHRLSLIGGAQCGFWCGDPPITITGATPDKPVLTITGSQDVYIQNLILTGGSGSGGNGLSVGNTSSVYGEVVKTVNNSVSGIMVSGDSALGLGDGSAVGNGGRAGIMVNGNSSLAVYGNTPWFPNPQPFNITGNAGAGIIVDRSELLLGGGILIEDNTGPGLVAPGAGIQAFGAHLSIGNWFGSDNVVRHNPIGVLLAEGSEMSMYGFTVQNNDTVGVLIMQGSRAKFDAQGAANTIEGNPRAGVEVVSHSQAGFYGPNKVRNNGSGTEPLRAGIRVDGTSQLSLEGGTEVTGNNGPGIFADINSSLDVTDSTIGGNTDEGIRVRHMSIAEIQGSTATAGNGGGSLTCDTSSLVITSLIAKTTKCANIEGAPGGPKPRTASTMRVAPSAQFMMQQARRAAERFKAPK